MNAFAAIIGPRPHRKIIAGRPDLGPISLGCATFGREIDAVSSFAMMDYAIARGITLFDTAAGYSNGKSEEIVGDWLQTHPSQTEHVLIATKLSPLYTPAAIETSVSASLRRLRIACIDVLYLHKWDETALDPATLTALHTLVESGRVRALGASNFSAAQLAACLQLQSSLGLTPFRVVQNNHNVAVRDVDADLISFCGKHEIAIITYSPLGAGFLTGKHQHGVAPGSRFDVIPGHQAIYFTPTATHRLERLTTLSRGTGQPMAHLALTWALHQPDVTSVLIGGRATSQLDQAFAALEVPTPTLRAQLAKL